MENLDKVFSSVVFKLTNLISQKDLAKRHGTSESSMSRAINGCADKSLKKRLILIEGGEKDTWSRHEIMEGLFIEVRKVGDLFFKRTSQSKWIEADKKDYFKLPKDSERIISVHVSYIKNGWVYKYFVLYQYNEPLRYPYNNSWVNCESYSLRPTSECKPEELMPCRYNALMKKLDLIYT